MSNNHLSNGESEPLLRRPLLSSQRSIINSTSQVAIVGANVCPIESLDYEIFENEFFKQDWRSRGVVQILQYICMKWLLCFMIGLIVGFIGFCNNLAVENLAGIKFVTTSNMMLERRFMFAFFIFFASNLSLTLFASIITAFIAPAAAGSGISEVKAYLNGVDAPGIFTVRTLFVKIIGSITAVSGSLVIGKAGPMVHTGACVAALLGQGGSKRYGITWRWLRFFKNDRDRRDLIICGSAAGIAAAFRAPVGGVLFALEEMASWWRTALLWRAFFTTATVAIFHRAMIDVCLSDKCGLFGKGGLIMFDAYSASISYHLVDVPPVFILAVVGGLLGSLFNFMTNKVLRIYNVINEKGTICRLFLACLISIFTSCLLFGLPWLAKCRPCPPDAVEPCPTIGRSGIYKKFQCPPNHYNGLASLIFNTNDDAIRNLFSMHTDNEFELSSMLVFFIICLFLSIFSCGIVAPAGLFVPIIVTGASYGRLVGILVGERTNLSNGLYAVLGAASLLGGSMRTTVSLCVIMLELTNNLLLLPLIMMVLVVSKSVANVFNANVYDLIMKAKGLPYLETHAEPYMRQLTVGDVVTGPLQMFNGIEKVRNIVFILRTTAHNGFPVIDEPPRSEAPVLFGIILRDHLITLLKKKAFLPSPMTNSYDVVRKFSSDDFAKKGSVERVKIEDIQLTEEEMGMFIDLHPFTNASPYTVVETMSLAKALILFREVGLRHLLVIPKIPGRSPVVGILTRHDFTPEHILVNQKWKGTRFLFSPNQAHKSDPPPPGSHHTTRTRPHHTRSVGKVKMKYQRIDTIFKRKAVDIQREEVIISSSEPEQVHENPIIEENESRPLKVNRVDPDDIENSLERDPGKRIPIWKYPPNQKDAIRRAYLKWGPYQSKLENYPMSGIGKTQRRFQHTWFSLFSSWLEYSPSEDAAYCLQCYLFSNKPSGRPGSEVFISTGFRSWKKVRNGEKCSFLKHIGKDPCSPHYNAMKACQDFLNQDGHLKNVIEVQSSSQILNNRLCLKASIDTVRWLTLQACAFRGHREGSKSRNQGNFLELLKLLASYNDEVAKVVLKNAPENCKYTSHQIQKEILQILSSRVRKHIREEIGDSKFCIVVDEARDESKKEQMALVLRFVDKAGLIQERFFDVARVNDTASLTLKEAVCGILSRHNLDVSNIRGQGYDGASNMRGEWNGLQALFLKDCPYAYYVHCFAHRLQLALVTASRKVASIHQFFEKLAFVVNVVGSSTKRHDELQAAQSKEIANLLETGEIVSGKGKNQVGTVKRAGDTRWSSHFNSICSLIGMYEATCTVLKIIAKDAKKFAQRADADSSYNYLKSFDFIFILHLMKEIMGTTDLLCQALQKQSQNVVNAMLLVRSTKALIQDLRENGWDKLFANVVSFCEKHDIEIPDLNDCHSTTRFGRSRLEENQVTIEHYFRVEIFFTTIDKQLQELNSRFSEQAMDLLTLSCALSPEDGYKAFDIDTICTLVEKYYPMDFSYQEKINLPFHLRHFLFEARQSSTFKNLSTIQELCSCLAAFIPVSGQPQNYLLLDRLLRLIMTLPVSTATTERSFSAMKIIKSKLRNKMGPDYLADSMSVYIEREISACISSESIIDDFKALGKRKVHL